MSDYLSTDDLSDLIGCKSNQRSRMIEWLMKNRWIFIVDCNGVPKVLKAYRDKRMGMSDPDAARAGFATGPDLTIRPRPPR